MALRLDSNLLAGYANPKLSQGSALASGIRGGLQGFAQGQELAHKRDANTRAEQESDQRISASKSSQSIAEEQNQRARDDHEEKLRNAELRRKNLELGVETLEAQLTNLQTNGRILSLQEEEEAKTLQARIQARYLEIDSIEASINSSNAATASSASSTNLNQARLRAFEQTEASSAALTNAQNEAQLAVELKKPQSLRQFNRLSSDLASSNNANEQRAMFREALVSGDLLPEHIAEIKATFPEVGGKTDTVLAAINAAASGQKQKAIAMLSSAYEASGDGDVVDLDVNTSSGDISEYTVTVERLVDGVVVKETKPYKQFLPVDQQIEIYKEETDAAYARSQLQLAENKSANKQAMTLLEYELDQIADQQGFQVNDVPEQFLGEAAAVFNQASPDGTQARQADGSYIPQISMIARAAAIRSKASGGTLSPQEALEVVTREVITGAPTMQRKGYKAFAQELLGVPVDQEPGLSVPNVNTDTSTEGAVDRAVSTSQSVSDKVSGKAQQTGAFAGRQAAVRKTTPAPAPSAKLKASDAVDRASIDAYFKQLKNDEGMSTAQAVKFMVSGGVKVPESAIDRLNISDEEKAKLKKQLKEGN